MTTYGRHSPAGQVKRGQVTINIQGIKALSERLDAFGRKVKQKAMREALSATAKVLRDEVKRNVPKDTKILSQSIVFKVFTDRRDATRWKARIGARNKRQYVSVTSAGAKKLTAARERKLNAKGASFRKKAYNPAKYMHLIELGTKRGVSPHRVMANAVSTKGRQAVNVGIEKMKYAINRAVVDVARGDYR